MFWGRQRISLGGELFFCLESKINAFYLGNSSSSLSGWENVSEWKWSQWRLRDGGIALSVPPGLQREATETWEWEESGEIWSKKWQASNYQANEWTQTSSERRKPGGYAGFPRVHGTTVHGRGILCHLDNEGKSAPRDLGDLGTILHNRHNRTNKSAQNQFKPLTRGLLVGMMKQARAKTVE